MHIDYAKPFKGKMWLFQIDSFSEWPEIVETTYTSASSTINKFKHIFAPHGLPEQIVSDDGPQFTAKEFKDYCSSDGILYKITAPYHPGLNGKVERLVKTFKNSVQKANPTSRTQVQPIFLQDTKLLLILLLVRHLQNCWMED